MRRKSIERRYAGGKTFIYSTRNHELECSLLYNIITLPVCPKSTLSPHSDRSAVLPNKRRAAVGEKPQEKLTRAFYRNGERKHTNCDETVYSLKQVQTDM